MSEVLGTLLGRVGGSILDNFISSFLYDWLRGASITFRTELAISQDWLKTITADALDSLIEEEPHANTAISTAGLTDIFERFMRAVAQASMILSADIAEELYTEMLQEGFSNAIQVSVGGALQSLLSTWRGGYPLSYDEASELFEVVEDLDADTLGLLLAQSGSNIPTSIFRVKQGFDRWVERELIALRTQLFEISNRLNDILAYRVDRGTDIAIRQYNDALQVLREAYSKAVSLIDQVCERALSRLQELKNECETFKMWYEWSLEHPETPIVSEDEITMLATENKLEAEAIVTSVNAILSKIESSLASFDIELDTVLNSIDTCVAHGATHLNKMIQQGIIEISEVVEKINDAVNILLAYRNAVDLQTSKTTSLTTSVGYEGYTPPQPGAFTVTFQTNVVGAKIVLFDSKRTYWGYTDSEGILVLESVLSGSYHYVIVKEGYIPYQETLDVTEDLTVTVTLETYPTPPSYLPPEGYYVEQEHTFTEKFVVYYPMVLTEGLTRTESVEITIG